MTEDLRRLKFVRHADVYKAGVLAGHLSRTGRGSVVFSYTSGYLAGGARAVATTLPLASAPVEVPSGALPSFFSGLLPEGHRLTLLKDAVKTSLGDELSVLLAVGADVPGDVQVVPAGETPAEPQPQYPHLVLNEAAHLTGARALKVPVARHGVVADRHGRNGLLVERFDRVQDDGLRRVALEDAAQVLDLPPASKYAVSSEEVVGALAGLCKARAVAVRNLYMQFVYAWLTGNGDLHAKNAAILERRQGGWSVTPMYDIACTLLYGDDTMALTIAGRVKNLKARHWQDFAGGIGLPERAATAANKVALTAAEAIDLGALPFTGSPLNGALRELRFRRAELIGRI